MTQFAKRMIQDLLVFQYIRQRPPLMLYSCRQASQMKIQQLLEFYLIFYLILIEFRLYCLHSMITEG